MSETLATYATTLQTHAAPNRRRPRQLCGSVLRYGNEGWHFVAIKGHYAHFQKQHG